MPKAIQMPNPTQRQTRPTNANAHPGRILMEALGVRRKPEEIEIEKRAKNERRKAREEKKSNEAVAVEDVADFEDEMVVEDQEDRARFPRHREPAATFIESALDKKSKWKPTTVSKAVEPKTEAAAPSRANKRKGRTSKAINRGEDTRKAKRAYSGSVDGFDPEPETETSEVEQPKAKKRRPLASAATPLHRMKTLGKMDVTMQDKSAITPKPMKKVIRESEREGGDSQDETEDDFETPKVLKRHFVPPSSDEPNFEETIGLERTSEAESESVNNENEDLDSELGTNLQRIDFTMVHRNAKKNTGKKDKKAFRKEVEKRRAGNEKVVTAPSRIAAQVKESIPEHQNAAPSISMTSRGKIPELARSRDVKAAATTSKTRNNVQVATLDQKSRTSAITGNGINIALRSISTGKERGSKSKPNLKAITMATGSKSKPNSQAMTNATFILELSESDEDDSIERATILQSPLKGIKRLSSEAIVKIEKVSSYDANETKKRSRSKADILGNKDILSGWSKSIEPNFVYLYFYELNPWPMTKEIEVCAQRLWDWRFGDKYPLILSESPQHVQLLTQKLCDVRNQAASAAIGNVDIEFHLAAANDGFDLADYDQTAIVVARQSYAQYLLDDKRFIFGKLVSPDQDSMPVRKSQPYQSKLLLRTFSSSFKHIRDVNINDAPLPSSKSDHPKTLLAITTAAVERALTLAANDDYDFLANRLIPKPDHSHPTKKLTTSMFAFSEAAWESRVQFYLEKSIVKLKAKDWKNIMNAAAVYSNTIKTDDRSTAKPKLTEEELDLVWESSDSDSETGTPTRSTD